MSDARDRWNRRYGETGARQSGGGPPAPPAALVRAEPLLPSSGFAIDLAGGDGGGACHLARRGLATTLVDVSDVALERAETAARLAGLALTTVRADLSADPGGLLSDLIPDASSTGVIGCFHYLDRDLLRAVSAALRPGVVFVAAVATVRNLERHARPSARFLLEPGELSALIATGPVEVLYEREDWTPEGRHEAEMVVTGLA